jgi:hypothetical protein
MQTKALRRVEIKDADKGLVTAIFSTFDVIDSDDDVTLPGAFEDGAPWKISAYGHQSWMGALPAGKGTVRTTGTEAILDGQFFMNTTHGRDTFEVVKQMGELQEWSYSVHPLQVSYGDFEGQQVRFLEKLDKGEVSPVLAGAGVGTRTLAVKSGLTFAGEATAVLADVTALVDRAADVLAKRQEKGKGLGADSRAQVEQVQAQLKRFEQLLADPAPTATHQEDLQRIRLQVIARTRGIINV